MNVVLVTVAVVLMIPSFSAPCSILNPVQTEVGSRPAVQGTCSNNNLPIICLFREGTGVECDGPGGGFTGDDAAALVYSACGCSTEEETARELKRELNIID